MIVPGEVRVVPLTGIPEVLPQHDLATLIREALRAAGLELRDGDVLVVSSKIVSKAQGLRVHASPGQHGNVDDAPTTDELVLSQSARVVAERRTPTDMTRIVASFSGPVMAAAGVDSSNVGPHGGSLLLPADPDLAARMLYAGLLSAFAPHPLPRIGVVISDTAGRPWRDGQVDFALGACAVTVLDDLRGADHTDVDGRPLKVTARAVADEIAAAADLVKGKTQHVPAALVRGLPLSVVGSPGAQGARSLIRSGSADWFALGSVEAVRSSLGVPPGSEAARAVGVASSALETRRVRVQRAVGVALAGHARLSHPDVVIASDECVRVCIADDYLRGRVVARIEVALHSEHLADLEVREVSASAGECAEPSSDLYGDD